VQQISHVKVEPSQIPQQPRTPKLHTPSALQVKRYSLAAANQEILKDKQKLAEEN
jgi:hypothetical protein